MSAVAPDSGDKFDSGAVVVNDASNYVEILKLIVDGKGGRIFVRGDVSVAALGHFKMTWAPVAGGTHTTFKEDADFNTPDVLMPAATASLSTTAAGSSFDILFADLQGVGEIGFYAKKASGDATVRITGQLRAE